MSLAFAVDVVEGDRLEVVAWVVVVLFAPKAWYLFLYPWRCFVRHASVAHVPFAPEGEVLVGGAVLMVGGAVALDLQFWS